MPDILCPTCGAALTLGSRQWLCPKGHCFDVARQGYVNLLPVTQKHSLHPGDTRELGRKHPLRKKPPRRRLRHDRPGL